MNTLAKGDKAPDFEALDQDGNTHKLSDYAGKKLVIFFYPKSSTPGCTAEACNLRDNFEKFNSNNYALLGVSADSPEKQSRFKGKYQLPFPLIADESKTLINLFGVWGTKKFIGKVYYGILRTTFIINEDGIIIQIIDDVKTRDHSNQILKSN